MFHEDPIANNLALTVINDGDGTVCGYTYAHRVAAAQRSKIESYRQARKACANYRKTTLEQAHLASEIIVNYYTQHITELEGPIWLSS